MYMLEISLDKENKKLNITEDKTNSKGEISSNAVITVEFSKDEELKNSVIEEVNQAITANSVFNLTTSDAELNKVNESYASVDVYYGDDIYCGMIDDPSFTVNNKDHEVAITGDLSYYLGGTYRSGEFVLMDLSLNGVIEGKLDLTQYVYDKDYKEFEGHTFCVPHNIEARLTSIYGKNYMTLPPERQRKMHAVFMCADTAECYTNNEVLR